MAFITLSIILIGAALFLFIGQSDSFAAAAWFLMSCHGECATVQILKQKNHAPGEICDLSTVGKLMCGKENQVTLNEVSTSNGKTVEVKVLERGLSLMFVKPKVCEQSGEA